MAKEIDVSKVPTWATPDRNDIVEEIRWWEAQNIPWQLVRELRRRSNTNNIGQFGTTQATFNFPVDHAKYKGPMTPWVRAFSNGTGNIINPAVPMSSYLFKDGKMPIYKGFLLQGGEGFANAYGFQQKNGVLSEDRAIIGYQADGQPHYIDPKYRSLTWYNNQENNPQFPQNSVVPSVLPPPGITSVSIKTNRDMMSNATIQWKCYSLAQLEYMMPFWLSPKINVFLEIGWNLFNNDSLLDFNNKEKCWELIQRPELALNRYYESLGNYGLITGIISKYNFSTEDGFVYNCNTELISRQAMYSGFRVDNPTVTENKDGSTTEYINLKECLVTYLSFIKQVVKDNGNFIDYIIKNAERLLSSNKKEAQSKEKSEAIAAIMKAPANTKNPGKVFYNGKMENRIFMGRYEDVYGAYKLPQQASTADTIVKKSVQGLMAIASNFSKSQEDALTQSMVEPSTKPAIQYGAATEPTFAGRKIVSFADKDVDFDYNDSGNDEVWFQMDFVFELINLFCSEKTTNNNRIDISDFVVSAHPNLISCDKNVLIPNSIAPKVNIGRTPNPNGPKPRDGYLEAIDAANNSFLLQYYGKNLNHEITAGEKAEKESGNNPNKTQSFSIWKAARKARNTFKTLGAVRDDLDMLINKLYYMRGGKKAASAAFPFKETKTLGPRQYRGYYHGYFKHIYMSKSKLIEIGKDGSIKTLQQMVNKILNTINESVDNFWNFEVVNNPLGGLSIIDKNITVSEGTPIYQFELGSTSNVIKKINFDVTMTNDQVNQVLYGSGQNAATAAGQITEVAGDTKLNTAEKIEKITQIGRGVPAVSYVDRFDDEELKKLVREKINQLASEAKLAKENDAAPVEHDKGVPHGPLMDKNEEIRQLQTQGKQDQEVLVMRIRAMKPDEDPYGPIPPGTENYFGWVYLNLPPTLKPKLREMLDDGDLQNNTARYAGPADNFTITMSLDGIFGFRMFQHFAISNLPKPYVPGNVIFMISEVEHQLNAGKWETIVTAMLKTTGGRNLKYTTI
jgi:hypothetical protein